MNVTAIILVIGFLFAIGTQFLLFYQFLKELNINVSIQVQHEREEAYNLTEGELEDAIERNRPQTREDQKDETVNQVSEEYNGLRDLDPKESLQDLTGDRQ